MKSWRVKALLLVLYDLMAVSGAYLLALWLRFDLHFSEIPTSYLTAWKSFAPLYSMGCVVIFARLRLYRSLWSFASFTEFTRVLLSSAITAVLHTVGITLLYQRMPISYYIMGVGIQFVMVLGIRFSYRFLVLERNKYKRLHMGHSSRVMIIGAGVAGQMILRDLHNSKESTERVWCFIDDDPDKWGRDIDGVPIAGGREDILYNVDKYNIEKIFLAIPSASAQTRRDLLDICKETGCELRSLPSLYQLASGQVTVSSMKPVEIEDLLGREPIRVNLDEIDEFLTGATVLVTGGGGSIGSELCRQIAKHHPKQLIIFDIYENNAYSIQLELKDLYPELDLVVLIGSVRDSRRIYQVFEKYKPQIVYHAAAHKHVPLMEDSPCESIKNNAIGTYKTAYAAMMNGCKRFVLISTDKAVNPTNIMGASKRVCEMIIQSFDRKIRTGRAHEIAPLHVHMEDADGNMQMGDSLLQNGERKIETEFVAVRFGNVLGSNGSVIPIFKKQIAKGGPVTVTHPDIIRYFMTIPEAASLVLQAGIYAHGGEIFVLDMGSPVKIDTLARNLIRLSGLQPDVDIQIEYTGLRPGEKLYEEKLMLEEGMRTTPNQLIHIGSPIPFCEETFLKQMQEMMEVAYDGDEEKMHELVETVVGTYNHAGEGGSEEKGAAYSSQIKEIEER